MKKVLSIRAEEKTHEGLRDLARIREVAIGDLLDALVKEELGRLKRNVGAILKAEEPKIERKEQNASANNKKRKKKRR